MRSLLELRKKSERKVKQAKKNTAKKCSHKKMLWKSLIKTHSFWFAPEIRNSKQKKHNLI